MKRITIAMLLMLLATIAVQAQTCVPSFAALNDQVVFSGSATQAGSLRIAGSGIGIYEGTGLSIGSGFNFASTAVNGDFTLEARQTYVTSYNGAVYPTSGLWTYTAGSNPYLVYENVMWHGSTYTLQVAYAHAIQPGRETIHTVYSASIPNPASTPIYEKLVRSGTTWTAYSSPNGNNWTMLGTSFTLSTADPTLVGIAADNGGGGSPNNALGGGIFDNISVNSSAPTLLDSDYFTALTSPGWAIPGLQSGTIEVGPDNISGIGRQNGYCSPTMLVQNAVKIVNANTGAVVLSSGVWANGEYQNCVTSCNFAINPNTFVTGTLVHGTPYTFTSATTLEFLGNGAGQTTYTKTIPLNP
jgi:hypothetical protein